MAEFTPINTQEELNNIIGERLRREREKVTGELKSAYEQQISDKDNELNQFRTEMETLKGQLASANEKISGIPEMENQIRGYQTAAMRDKVAREAGIPYELAGRLAGETEEDLRKDAENLRRLIGAARPTAPLAGGERNIGKQNSTDNAWLKFAQDMKGD